MSALSPKDHLLHALAWIGSRVFPGAPAAAQTLPPRRILVFQAGGIGDLLRIFPLLESLHAAYPQAELFTLSPFSTSVFELLPNPGIITRSLGYHPTGEHAALSAKLRLARALRASRFDLIVNPARGQGMLQNGLLAWAAGAPVRVGFDDTGAGFANTVRVPLHADQPILEQNLNLLRALHLTPEITDVHIRVAPKDDAAAARLMTDRGLTPPFMAIHPGSTWQSKLQWPLDRYIALVRALLDTFPGNIVLLGTPPEAALGTALLQQVDSRRVCNLIGTTSLSLVAALLSHVALFIGNDSGLLHLALGLRTPAIGLFGYTAPRQVISPTGPCIALHKPGEAPLYRHQAFYTFDDSTPNPINNIHVVDVLEAARSLLTRR